MLGVTPVTPESSQIWKQPPSWRMEWRVYNQQWAKEGPSTQEEAMKAAVQNELSPEEEKI